MLVPKQLAFQLPELSRDQISVFIAAELAHKHRIVPSVHLDELLQPLHLSFVPVLLIELFLAIEAAAQNAPSLVLLLELLQDLLLSGA